MEEDSVEIGEDFLAHYGVVGMHWGIRRDPKTGVRPLAKSLDESRFGKLAKANANRYMRKQNTRALAKGKPFPKKSTSNNPSRKDINRNAAIDAARAAGFNKPKSSNRSGGRSLTTTDQRTNMALRRVASGKATIRDHLRASGSISLLSLIRNGGYRNAAQSRLDFNQARAARIRAGQATIQDRLSQWGNIPITNFG